MATDDRERDDRAPEETWAAIVNAGEKGAVQARTFGRPSSGGDLFEDLKAVAIVVGFLVVIGGIGGLLAYLRGPKETPAEQQMREFERDRKDREQMQRELKYLEESDKSFQDRKRKELEEAAEREREQKERFKKLNPYSQEP